MSALPSQKQPWELTATEVLPLLRAGKLTVTDYVKSLFERIQKRDEAVKPWVYLSPSLILQRAQELDALPQDQRGPLFGLPVGVKDVILTNDMPTQYNSKLYESEQPIAIDANIVMALRASGALIFGKTATTEFATSKQGNWHQNLTRNCYDPHRTPGGSSSGSGAAVGDFEVPIAIGTQTGGSVVRPASFNGCYGWKPTHGAISREGLAQWCPTLDTTGFFSRSISDFDILADVCRLHDDESVSKEPFKPAGAKVGMCRGHNWPNAGPGTHAAMSKAEDILRFHGAKVDRLDLPDEFKDILELHSIILSGEGQASFLGQYILGKDELHPSIQSHVQNDRNISRKQFVDAYDNIAALRPKWDGIARRYDVVITPSVVDEAPMGLENTGDMNFCSPWTALHCPVVNLIGFQGANGLPVGVTAVGARYEDRKLLQVCKSVAEVFEKEGGWKMSPP